MSPKAPSLAWGVGLAGHRQRAKVKAGGRIWRVQSLRPGDFIKCNSVPDTDTEVLAVILERGVVRPKLDREAGRRLFAENPELSLTLSEKIMDLSGMPADVRQEMTRNG